MRWPFAKEGRNHIIIAAILTVGMWFVHIWIFVFAVFVLLFVLQFFRDPDRKIVGRAGSYLSPADGAIVFAGPATNPETGDTNCLKVSIFMNVFNVHSNRIPVAGQILSIKRRPGKFFNAMLDKSSVENEANTIVIKTADHMRITVVQIAGLLARRIMCYVKEGEDVKLGQRYGFIRFGSRVDVYFPKNSTQLAVRVGEPVTAGVDRIAFISE